MQSVQLKVTKANIGTISGRKRKAAQISANRSSAKRFKTSNVAKEFETTPLKRNQIRGSAMKSETIRPVKSNMSSEKPKLVRKEDTPLPIAVITAGMNFEAQIPAPKQLLKQVPKVAFV